MEQEKKQSRSKSKETEAKKRAVKKAEVVAETAPVEAMPKAKLEIDKPEEKTTAKAGKRSAKSLKEAEEKQAKEASKTKPVEVAKKTVKPPRSRRERAGKNYRKVAKLIEQDKNYNLSQAIDLALKTNPSKFDAAVEIHINLGVDPKQADQNIRGTVSLPAGSGKKLRVAVLAEDDAAAQAKKAGADLAGLDDLLAQLDKQEINFDILIATPQLMSRLAKYAKLLGPRGLMPNPKSGTVSNDVVKAVTEAKAGRLEYRTDANGIIHAAIGKTSFKSDDLAQNAEVVLSAVRAAKPASLKGSYIRSIYLATTMGPSIKTDGSTP